MKKQIFSSFGLFFLLLNNFSSSMQPDQENAANISPPAHKQLPNIAPLCNKQIAQKFIAGTPEINKIVNLIITMKRIRSTYHDGEKSLFYRTYLLAGPPGSGKTTLVSAMATLLDTGINVIDLPRKKNPNQHDDSRLC